MSSTLFSRRKLFEAGAAAVAAAGVAAIPGASSARPPQEGESELESLFPGGGEERFRLSQQNAYLFLDTMMDAYAQRVYDPAFTELFRRNWIGEQPHSSTTTPWRCMARLLRGSGQDLDRAKVLGNCLRVRGHDNTLGHVRPQRYRFVARTQAVSQHLGAVQILSAPAQQPRHDLHGVV